MTRPLRPLFATIFCATPLMAGTTVFQTFEGDGFNDWQVAGTAFGLAPVAGKTDAMKGHITGYSNEYLAASNHGGPSSTGSLTSPEFTIDQPKIVFLIAGGDSPGKTCAQLLIDGKVVREAVGKRDLEVRPVTWMVEEFKGKKATIKLIDESTDPWGFIAVDHIVLSSDAAPAFPSTTKDGIIQIPGLVSTDVISGVTVPENTTLKIEASYKDHKLKSPTALTFDHLGNIYVAETHRFRFGVEDDRAYLFWYLDDLAAKTTADRRALHEKWQERMSLKRMTDSSEVIRRLADTDGDGTLDESKVFAEGFNDLLDGTGAGVFYQDGTLYFSCIPKLWMLRDTNGDGISDERKVIEEGFGVRISLSGHDMNGFALGPDGRIYGTIGDRGFSVKTKAGKVYDYPNEGAAFRFEPDGSGFEIFHTGLRNPKEIAFDTLGNLFSVDNNSDQGDRARVVYLAEGGDTGWQMEHQTMHTFHRQIGLEERPPNRWMDERMWELQNETQPAYILPPAAYLTSGPSGLTYHPGTGFLAKENGRFVVCDYRGGPANSGLWSFTMEPDGAGMKMKDSRKLAWGIAASDVEYSWDGRLFVSDFVTGWASHDDGRLLSINPDNEMWRAKEAADAAKLVREGFDQRSSGELAGLLKHPDFRVRLRAQVAITRKPDSVERFTTASSSTDMLERVHGIWGLGIIARRGAGVPLPVSEFADLPDVRRKKAATDRLIALLADPEEEIRCQTLRALGDAEVSGNALPLGPLLADESPRVRYFAAITAGKRKGIGLYSAILDLLEQNNNRDAYLRHAGAFALENMSRDATQLTALADYESAAVRLAAVVALRRMKDPAVVVFLGDADPKVSDEAIRAITDLDLGGAREQVSALLDDTGVKKRSPMILRRLIHNAFRTGTVEDAARILKVAGDPGFPNEVRKEALRLMALWSDPFPADQFSGHWRPLPKRDAKLIHKALETALPGLLSQQGFILTGALNLVERYKLNIASLDDAALRGLASNGQLPPAARSKALGLLIDRGSPKLEAFLTEISSDPADEVAFSALSELARRSPESALAPLEAAIDSGNVTRGQKAWEILANLQGKNIASVFVKHLEKLQAAKGVSPHALELLAAAKSRKEPEIASALAAYEKAMSGDPDPLSKWNVAIKGGNPVAGAELFRSHPAGQCMRCHLAEDGHAAGGDAGPNLAGIGKRHTDPRYFLESMVATSASIAPGFGSVLVTLKNDATVGGNLIAESPEHIDIDTGEKSLRVKRGDIKSYTPPVSPMPSMEGLLSASELRNLVAWLATLDKGGEEPKAEKAPEPLDPATLLKETSSAGPSDADLMKTGKQQFLICGACHGQSAEGTPAGPPLAGSEWVNGPAENLIRIQLRGLQGPIKVKGTEHNVPGGMQPMAYQTDEQIAGVLTYIRGSFGNKAPAVSPAEVTALRSEVGRPQLTAGELVSPVAK